MCSILIPRCDPATGNPLPACVDKCIQAASDSSGCLNNVNFCLNNGVAYNSEPNCTDWGSYNGGNYSVTYVNTTTIPNPPFTCTPSSIIGGTMVAKFPYAIPSALLSSSEGGSSFLLELISFRELTSNQTFVREAFLNQMSWSCNFDSSLNQMQFITQTSIGSQIVNFTFNFMAFKNDTNITYGGSIYNYPAGSFKFSINLSPWPFLDTSNQLLFLFSVTASDEVQSCMSIFF